jgi:hypothetical protein
MSAWPVAGAPMVDNCCAREPSSSMLDAMAAMEVERDKREEGQ